MRNERDIFEEARRVRLDSYMEGLGFEFKKAWGDTKVCSSPFSNDSNPSFVYYERTNSFYDFSTANGGSIIDFIHLLQGVTFLEAAVLITEDKELESVEKNFKPKKKKVFPFNADKHKIRWNREKINEVVSYAKGRGITQGIEKCLYFTHDGKEFIPVLAMGFMHTDIDGKECGIKMRAIDPLVTPRFKAKGRMKYYVLDNVIGSSYEEPTLFIVESESSANSLWEYLKGNGISCVVISFGAVSSVPKELPNKYKNLKNIKIIIDYDGSEKLFKKRADKYKHFNGELIKLRLEKGEDLNSLYVKDKLNLIKLW